MAITTNNDDDLIVDFSAFGNKDILGIFLRCDYGVIKESNTTYASIVVIPHYDFIGTFLPMKLSISYDQARCIRVPHFSQIKFDVDMVGSFEVKQMVNNVRFLKQVNRSVLKDLYDFDSSQEFSPNVVRRGYPSVGLFVTAASGTLQTGDIWANSVVFPPLSQTQNVFTPVKYTVTSTDFGTLSTLPVPSLIHFYHAPAPKVKKSKPLLFTPDLIRPIARDEILTLYS